MLSTTFLSYRFGIVAESSVSGTAKIDRRCQRLASAPSRPSSTYAYVRPRRGWRTGHQAACAPRSSTSRRWFRRTAAATATRAASSWRVTPSLKAACKRISGTADGHTSLSFRVAYRDDRIPTAPPPLTRNLSASKRLHGIDARRHQRACDARVRSLRVLLPKREKYYQVCGHRRESHGQRTQWIERPVTVVRLHSSQVTRMRLTACDGSCFYVLKFGNRSAGNGISDETVIAVIQQFQTRRHDFLNDCVLEVNFLILNLPLVANVKKRSCMFLSLVNIITIKSQRLIDSRNEVRSFLYATKTYTK